SWLPVEHKTHNETRNKNAPVERGLFSAPARFWSFVLLFFSPRGDRSSVWNLDDARWRVARFRTAMKSQLAQAALVDRTAQNALRLLRRVEAHGVFRNHEVDHELAAALVVAGLGQLHRSGFLPVGLDVGDQVHQGVQRGVAQAEE